MADPVGTLVKLSFGRASPAIARALLVIQVVKGMIGKVGMHVIGTAGGDA